MKIIFHYDTEHELRGYEYELGKLEVEGLFPNAEIRESGDSLQIKLDKNPNVNFLNRLTFFRDIELSEDKIIHPIQFYLNRFAKLSNKRSNLPTIKKFANIQPNIREHSYSTHNLHSYKGKYYPQLVSSIVNVLGIKKGVVLDPWCGCGTTNLECFLRRIPSVGIDLNPLAVLIAETRIEILQADCEKLHLELERLEDYLVKTFKKSNLRYNTTHKLKDSHQPNRQFFDLEDCIGELPKENRDYLRSWFDEKTLMEICVILSSIYEKVKYKPALRLAKICLSNIIRSVSLQNEDHLRVLRLKTTPQNPLVLESFLYQVRKALRTVRVHDRYKSDINLKGAPYEILEFDTRKLSKIKSSKILDEGSVAAVVTSPPYATALPYIDTHRLSLFILNLLGKPDRKSLEQRMIGNREISTRKRRELEDELLNDPHPLIPESVLKFITNFYKQVEKANVGFRRKNKPALIYKYFKDMAISIRQITPFVRKGGYFTYVVGANQTKISSSKITIPSHRLLLDTLEQGGFEHVNSIPMTDQRAFEAHQRHMINAEYIVVTRKIRELT